MALGGNEMIKQVYFDNSATTKPAPEVIESMVAVLEKYYGNPSSLHHLGVETEKLMNRSRQLSAQLLEVNEEEILFTSGGTESNNLAIKGIAFGYQNRGKHIITTEIEHSSVYEVCQELENKYDFEVTYLPVNKQGQISLDQLKDALRDDTILVSIMHVNNEMGSIQPLSVIGQILHQYPKVFFHVDQVQGIGKVPLSIKESYIDLLSLSGHKIHAPKGTGILYKHHRIQQLYPLFHGGAQQKEIRPGTENVAGIVALTKALRMVKENEAEHIQYLQQLRQKTIEGLQSIQGVNINSPTDLKYAAPHIVNASFLGIKPEVFVHALEEKGIYVSTKSACSSKEDKPSRILMALEEDENIAKSAVRISFSVNNTLEEVDYFLTVLKEIVPHYQKIMKV